ncbi:hypothetical protein, partial [Candidatus Macondimonas diazotrophica]|uniref:hypothetical protein n=1 Tax=Candidatus Macondimonas diazotrophica TaxID=2305248 RepID=UPI00196A9273
ITDVGLEQMTVTGWKSYCHVGTGTTTPSETDSALASPVMSTNARSNGSDSNAGAPSYYSQVSVDYTFPVQAGTWTEVGVSNKAHTDGTQVLYSRALIVDGAGNPTSITTLADEYLVVTYRLRLYPPLADVNGEVSILADTYNYTLRAASVSSSFNWAEALQDNGKSVLFNGQSGQYLKAYFYAGDIRTITDGAPYSPEVYDSSNSDFTAHSYVGGSLRTTGAVRLPYGSGNSSGYIRSIMWRQMRNSGGAWSFQRYQCQFFPDIPKDNTYQYTFSLGVGWGRYVAS